MRLSNSKKYQEDGILWLQTCHRLRPHRRGSLLADDMGLGKTLQVFDLLGLVHREHDKELQLSTPAAPWRPILIIVPLILLGESHMGEGDKRQV